MRLFLIRASAALLLCLGPSSLHGAERAKAPAEIPELGVPLPAALEPGLARPAFPEAALPALSPTAVPQAQASSEAPAQAEQALPSLLANGPEAGKAAAQPGGESASAASGDNFSLSAGLAVPASPTASAEAFAGPDGSQSGSLGDGESRLAIGAVEERIRKALDEGRTPAVVLDLDNTAFFLSSRYEAILREFDSVHRTSYFADLHYSSIPLSDRGEFLAAYLQKKDPAQATKPLLRELGQFIQRLERRPEIVLADVPNPPVVALASRWKKLGARIVYVSARTAKRDAATRESLARAGLPNDGLYLNPNAKTPAELHKPAAVARFEASEPGLEVVAALDDSEPVLAALRAARPDLLLVAVTLSSDPARRTFATRLSIR